MEVILIDSPHAVDSVCLSNGCACTRVIAYANEYNYSSETSEALLCVDSHVKFG